MDVKQFKDFLARKSRGDITRALHRLAIRKAARAEKHAKKNAGRVLNVRSGRLRGSIASSVKVDSNRNLVISLRAGGRDKDVTYAGIHEYGGRNGTGIIKPVNARYLYIPVHKSLFTKGGARYASVRDVPEPLTPPLMSRRGNMVVLSQRTGEVFYALKDQVKIPRRPFLKPAIDRVAREVGRELRPLIRGEVAIG